MRNHHVGYMFSRLSKFTEQTFKKMRGTLEQGFKNKYTLKLKQISVAVFKNRRRKCCGNSKKKESKKKNGWEISKDHLENRLDPRKNRRTLAFNIILFAQKEIIFVKEKLPQTM